jgi:hypothetical protein
MFVAPAASAACFVDAEVVRSRTPSAGGSIRWSIPRIQAGESVSCFALSPTARMTAVAPSATSG